MQGLTVEPLVRGDSTLRAMAAYGLAGTRRALPTAPLDPSEWRVFLDAVGRHRLVGLLGSAIADGAFPATDAQIEEAAALQTDVAVVALLLERLLLSVADGFDAAGIDFRVLKGPASAHLDYPQPGLRSFGDLDLLVRGVDFAWAIERLEEQGGRRRVPELRRGFDRRFGKGAVIAMPGDLEIDLHRVFVSGPLGMTIDVDDLFATSTPFGLGDRRLAGLGTPERFLHACIHAAVGRPARLSSLRDVAQMGLRADLDLDRIRGLAQSWRASAVVAHAVDLAWTTLDLADSVALSAWAAGYRADRSDRRLLHSYLGGDQSYTRQAFATLRVIRRRRDKIAYARSLLLPERRYLEARSGSRIAHVRRGTTHLRWDVPR